MLGDEIQDWKDEILLLDTKSLSSTSRKSDSDISAPEEHAGLTSLI